MLLETKKAPASSEAGALGGAVWRKQKPRQGIPDRGVCGQTTAATSPTVTRNPTSSQEATCSWSMVALMQEQLTSTDPIEDTRVTFTETRARVS